MMTNAAAQSPALKAKKGGPKKDVGTGDEPVALDTGDPEYGNERERSGAGKH